MGTGRRVAARGAGSRFGRWALSAWSPPHADHARPRTGDVIPPMELVILGLIVLFAYLFIRLTAKFWRWMSGTRYRAYRRLATRFNGRYESRGLSDTPTVSFIHHGSTVRVGLAPTIAGQPGQSPERAWSPGSNRAFPFGMELAPASRRCPAPAPQGHSPVKLGDPEFDRAYVVQANDLEMARDFLGRRYGPPSPTCNAGYMPGACWYPSIPSDCWFKSTVTLARAARR